MTWRSVLFEFFFSNRIIGVMVSVLASSPVDRVLASSPVDRVLASSPVDRGIGGQTKDYQIGICCFSTKHAVLRRKSKDWLARNQDNVSKWGDMSICGLLFQ